MFEPLLQHIARYIELACEEQQQVMQYFTIKHLRKKDFVLSEGEICMASYFVLKGLMRMYFIRDSGVHQVTQFALERWWLTDQMSLDMQKPSLFFIDAVEETATAVLTRKQQDELLAAVPKMERYFRLIMQRSVAASQMRLTFFLDKSAEERYRNFNRNFPEFVQRIPQYMLASYLDITPEVLSKIRAKK